MSSFKPPTKRSKDDSDSDSGPEDSGPAPVKKSKKISAKADPAKPKSPKKKSAKAGGSVDALNDGSGEPSWSLGNMKFAKVREWKGKMYVDIREFYVDKSSMETKPGKKGISLTVEQYQKLKEIISEIDSKLG